MSVEMPNTTNTPNVDDWNKSIANDANKYGDDIRKFIDDNVKKYSKQFTDDMKNAMTPGENNPQYQSALKDWSSKNPDAAKNFDKSANDPKQKKQVINQLQMAINKGEITKDQASKLLTQGPAAHEYDFSSKGHNGTSAGAYSIAHETGGALDGDSSDPKKAGREYIASQVFSLGGTIRNPLSIALDPTESHSAQNILSPLISPMSIGGQWLGQLG
ncbi:MULTISPECIES: hypothetical protein [Burkholderia]|uniref:hypothetical protein n=1 Tax=Burkholderia TaxID=32008 RepID=UPI001E5C2717|nr:MULTISPECIES: hypothetical protein [unclassified Burkholderia]UEP32571.1 hypothetical protein LMA01_34650 [Burkholderia sp. B21-007]UEP46371.1 hypothetical protein LMA02_31625 [Burkholderia sp. B21-005]